ncbi:MAG: multicopper oxidase domain-containing protein [Bacteroidia bacterium]
MLKSTYNFIMLLMLFFSISTKALTITKTLYINKGQFVAIDSSQKAPYYAFNSSRIFDAHNTVFTITTADILVLKIINTDTIKHGFNVKNHTQLNSVINPGDSVTHTLNFNTQGVFIYYDSYDYPKFSYMGAAGMICVDNNTFCKKFYWNLKEHQLSYNYQLDANKTVNWKNYSPDWYTTNGLSYPFISTDTSTFVLGELGDTIHIFVATTGQAAHSMHFHGFHCKIIASSNPKYLGWMKDTFPINKMEGVIFELIADQLGQYAVHDANLMTRAGGGVLLYGMINSISILKK